MLKLRLGEESDERESERGADAQPPTKPTTFGLLTFVQDDYFLLAQPQAIEHQIADALARVAFIPTI